MAKDDIKISDVRHPEYQACYLDWKKWRLTYQGGDEFINEYLKQYSNLESTPDFALRRCVTPSPSFAKAAVNDIKNSIFQRLTDITRRGGTNSYQRAVEGKDNGVDLHGSTMSGFIGQQVLPELLSMKKVGVYVDMPANPGNTLIEAAGKRPYIYVYRAEQIYSWTWRVDRADEYSAILLCDYIDCCHPGTGLPMGKAARYRHMWIDRDDGKVHACFYNEAGYTTDSEGGSPGYGEVVLDIDYIPFAIGELTDSLLADVANHQIALLNMESSDVGYALKSNYPFYIEQQDSRLNSQHLKNIQGNNGAALDSGIKQIELGTSQGRTYTGDQAPGFINPSAEPLRVSMEKQRELKGDIRELVNLSLSTVRPKMASAESKQIDNQGLEAGLSYVGIVLEHLERKIGWFWTAYESKSIEPPDVKYPEKYSLTSDADRREQVLKLSEVRDLIPSDTARREITCEMAMLLLGSKLSIDTMDKIKVEIMEAKAYTADAKTVVENVINGIIAKEDAALLFGYPKETVAKADKEHIARATAIAEAQAKAKPEPAAGARGVNDLSADPAGDVRSEKDKAKKDSETAGNGTPVRGEGK